MTLLLAMSVLSTTAGSVILMAIGFGLMILVHEFGHFIVAKWVGIKVEEFAVGFGKRLWSFRRGETEYRLNVIPLGGYVKMLGQDDFKLKESEEMDPRSYAAKPVWARICVVSAGVVMNIILAVVLFIFIFWAGIRFTAPVVGGVNPGFPAATVELPDGRGVGLKSGDQVLAINGKPIHKFEMLSIKATLSSAGQMFDMTIGRPTGPDGKLDIFNIDVGTKGQKTESGATRYAFGILSPLDRMVADGNILGYLGKERLEAKDTITEFAGQKVNAGWELTTKLDELSNEAVDIVVDRKDAQGESQTHTVRLLPHLTWSNAYVEAKAKELEVGEKSAPGKNSGNAFNVLGLQPRMRVLLVDEESPAGKAGIQTGDIIVAYGDPAIIPTVERMQEESKQYLGRDVTLVVMRDEKILDPIKVQVKELQGLARIGISSVQDDSHLVVADTLKGSPLEGQIPSGATITAVNDTPVNTWPELIAALKPLDGQQVVIHFRKSGGEEAQTKPLPLNKDVFLAANYGYELFIPRNAEQGPLVQTYNPAEAAWWGAQETGDFIVQVYATLRGFIQGRVSGKEFSGPVAIFRWGVMAGERGTVWLLYLLAMISANLAVINFLPLPIVDGGHVVLLLAEKIRRRPLGVGVQNAIQLAGLILIAVVFVLITYNDIAQWIRSKW